MSFVQALLSMGYRPVPLSGAASEKVVDIAHPAHPGRASPIATTTSCWSATTATSWTAGGAPRRRPAGRRHRVHAVPQPRVHRRSSGAASRSSTWSTTCGVHRPAAPRPDHPDRRVRPARLPLGSSGGVRRLGRRPAGLQPGDRHPERRAGDVVQADLVEEVDRRPGRRRARRRRRGAGRGGPRGRASTACRTSAPTPVDVERLERGDPEDALAPGRRRRRTPRRRRGRTPTSSGSGRWCRRRRTPRPRRSRRRSARRAAARSWCRP